MRTLALLFFLFVLVHAIHAQENPRMELRHIRLEEAMSQHDFAMSYNICWEQVQQHLNTWELPVIPADTDLYFPPDMPPCYNEAGQRLIFYENGEPVYQPYYSDMRVYVIPFGETFESLTRTLNVCIDDISLHNEGLYTSVNGLAAPPFNTHTLASAQEVFIPDTPPCYDEQGRKLAYTGNGAIPLEGELLMTYRSVPFYREIVYGQNICEEDLLAANHLDEWPANRTAQFLSIVIPANTAPCYRIYLESDETAAEIRALQSRCHAQLEQHDIYRANGTIHRYYLRGDAPCLNPDYVPEGEWVDLAGSNTLETISRQYNVCPSDLLAQRADNLWRINFLIQIPDTPPCYNENGYKLIYPEDGSAPYPAALPSTVAENYARLLSIAWQHQICLNDLLLANPHLQFGENLRWLDNGEPQDLAYSSINEIYIHYGTELFLPESSADCYEEHVVSSDEALFDLAIQENVCMERLLSWRVPRSNPATYMIPVNHEACYDENGHRLSYNTETGMPIRLDNEIYVMPYTMSVYELSRRLNVCINDLIALNPRIQFKVPHPRLEIFVPETPACYDEITGQQLIYTDESGDALAEPRLSDYPLYRVRLGDSWSSVSRLYNVCANRIMDFNEGFLPNVWEIERYYGGMEYFAREEGIFDVGVLVRIPTDRPPCYDLTEASPRLLRYVCYDNSIDMSIENPDAVINPDGTNCYNIEDPATVIWDNGDHYLYQKRQGNLYTNDFMAWCFGVSSSDILGENSLVYIWPQYEVLVKNPTRSCYVHTPDGLENVHWVTWGETLNDIAWQYGKLPQWIAEANGLMNPDIIWEYQRLVIPEGINLWDLAKSLSAFAGISFLVSGGFFFLRRRRMNATMKKKREAEKDKTKV